MVVSRLKLEFETLGEVWFVGEGDPFNLHGRLFLSLANVVFFLNCSYAISTFYLTASNKNLSLFKSIDSYLSTSLLYFFSAYLPAPYFSHFMSLLASFKIWSLCSFDNFMFIMHLSIYSSILYFALSIFSSASGDWNSFWSITLTIRLSRERISSCSVSMTDYTSKLICPSEIKVPFFWRSGLYS